MNGRVRESGRGKKDRGLDGGGVVVPEDDCLSRTR